jgi:DNA-directed RNA polymerase specialized sigma24 family protein
MAILSLRAIPMPGPRLTTNDVDDAGVEDLVVAAAGGDEEAWKKLWAEIEAPLSKIIARPSFLGRLGMQEDDRREIVLRVMARVRADEFKRLHQYLDVRRHNEALRFMSWLRVVAKRVGIDYMRAHPNYKRRHDADPSRPGEWIDPGTLPPASQLVGGRPPVTNTGTARELLEYAAGAIPDDQLRAITLWSQSESFEEIAKALGLANPNTAEKMVRAALERLRRKFRDSTQDGTG